MQKICIPLQKSRHQNMMLCKITAIRLGLRGKWLQPRKPRKTTAQCLEWKLFIMILVISTYLCAQFVRQEDSFELNLLPGVPSMHLSQQALVIFPTVSVIIAFCCSCCIKPIISHQQLNLEQQELRQLFFTKKYWNGSSKFMILIIWVHN